MPNRILRDYTRSEKIDSISFEAECLFIRLMTQADDFGTFHANPKIVKASCFPLKSISEDKVSKMIFELHKHKLIVKFEHDGKPYLNITDFGQRLRAMRNKFPKVPENVLVTELDSNSPQLAADCRNSPPETEEKQNPNQKPKQESESETESELPSANFSFESFISIFNIIMESNFKGDSKSKTQFSARVNEGFTEHDFKTAIENAKEDDFQKKNGYKYLTPAYITRSDILQKWMNMKPVQVTKQLSEFDKTQQRINELQKQYEDGNSSQDGRIAS